jgi:hypothetical protein
LASPLLISLGYNRERTQSRDQAETDEKKTRNFVRCNGIKKNVHVQLQ